MKQILVILAILSLTMLFAACGRQTSDDVQQQQQEQLLSEGTKQTGMPAIKNFRERKIMKDILELRDQEGLITYSYVYSDMTGKFRFFGETIGYPIPYATQYTNPQKVYSYTSVRITLPQADPNGLFSPASAEGTWLLMRDPAGKKVVPVYCEPRVICLPFKLPDDHPLLR